MARIKHWGDRTIKWVIAQHGNKVEVGPWNAHLYSGTTLIVYKEQAFPPHVVKWHIELGADWLRDNFPIDYAGFLTMLMQVPGKLSDWNRLGHVSDSWFEEEKRYYAVHPPNKTLKEEHDERKAIKMPFYME